MRQEMRAAMGCLGEPEAEIIINRAVNAALERGYEGRPFQEVVADEATAILWNTAVLAVQEIQEEDPGFESGEVLDLIQIQYRDYSGVERVNRLAEVIAGFDRIRPVAQAIIHKFAK